MNVVRVGLDVAKNVFQVHGVDETGAVVVRRRLRRAEVIAFFAHWMVPLSVGPRHDVDKSTHAAASAIRPEQKEHRSWQESLRTLAGSAAIANHMVSVVTLPGLG